MIRSATLNAIAKWFALYPKSKVTYTPVDFYAFIPANDRYRLSQGCKKLRCAELSANTPDYLIRHFN
jgi:homospermidine synthase